MVRSWLRSFLGVFVIATVAALCARLYLVEAYRIASNSMYPELETGDLILVAKYAFNLRLPFSTYELLTLHRPKRGEVVAFTLPDHGLQTFVKRVVALEGDRVDFQNGVLRVNDRPADYQPLPQPNEERETLEGRGYVVEKDKGPGYGPVDIPPGHFFALGDNRPDSVDSRTWGPVPYSCLKGRVSLVWASLGPTGSLRRDRVGVWIR